MTVPMAGGEQQMLADAPSKAEVVVCTIPVIPVVVLSEYFYCAFITFELLDFVVESSDRLV